MRNDPCVIRWTGPGMLVLAATFVVFPRHVDRLANSLNLPVRGMRVPTNKD